jgi:hypothetical protein
MADAPQDCIAQRDDYLECLHHTKEVSTRRRFLRLVGDEGVNRKSKTAINSIQRIKPSMTALAQILFKCTKRPGHLFFFLAYIHIWLCPIPSAKMIGKK